MAGEAPAYPPLRLRPLGLGDVIDETARLYLRHFRRFVEVGAVALVPVGLLSAIPDLIFDAEEFSEARIFVAIAGGALWVPAMLVTLAAMTYLMSDVCLGRRPSVREVYGQVLGRLLPFLGLGLIVGAVLAILSVTLIGIPVAVYLFIMWLVSHVVLLIERQPIFRALGRSRRLVQGSWWRVFFFSIVLYFIYGILNGLFSFPAAMLSLIALAAELTGLFGGAVRILTYLLNVAGQVLVLPLYFGAYTVIYYDLRVRREALDIEQQAGELGLLPAAA